MTRPIHLGVEFKAQRVLPANPSRRVEAERWLEGLLAAWSLQPGVAGRWLASADAHLRSEADLVLAAEFSPELQVFSLELWRGDRRIYGIDDWLGDLGG